MDAADDILIVESMYVPEQLLGLDPVRASLRVAELRGTYASSAIVTGAGMAVSSTAHEDREVAVAADGQRAAFVRTPTAESYGATVGSSWARAHSPDLAYRSGSPYIGLPPTGLHLYIEPDFDSGNSSPIAVPTPTELAPIALAWHPSGAYVAVASHISGQPFSPDARFRITELDVSDGSIVRTHWLSAGLCEPARLSYSADGEYLLVADVDRQRSALIQRGSSRAIVLPIRSAAVDWHPTIADSLLSIHCTSEMSAEVQLFDLARWESAFVGLLQDDRRVDFRELAIHPNGTHALACAPIGTSAEIQEGVRGGLYATAIIDLTEMAFEPVLSAHFEVADVQRVHLSPQWSVPRTDRTPTHVAEHIWEAAESTAEASEIDADVLQRRAQVCAEQARELRRARRHQAFSAQSHDADIQALSEAAKLATPADVDVRSELDFDVDSNLSALLEIAQLTQPGSAMAGTNSVGARDLRPGGSPSCFVIPLASRRQLGEIPPDIRQAVEDLVAAPDQEDSADAAQRLQVRLSGTAGTAWDALLEMQYSVPPRDVALIALAAFNWCVEVTEMVPMLLSAMTRPTLSAEAQILRNGCSACLLIGDDDAFVARGRDHPYDVGEVLARSVYRLGQLDSESG